MKEWEAGFLSSQLWIWEYWGVLKIQDVVILNAIPGLGRSPIEGRSNPLQYSCLENLRDRGAWQALACGVTESDMTEHTQINGISLLGFLNNVYLM